MHPNVGKPLPVGQSLAVMQVGAQIFLADGSVVQVQPCEFGGHFCAVQSAFVVHDGGPPPDGSPSAEPMPPSPPAGCAWLQDAGIVAVKRISPRSRPIRQGGDEPSAAAAW